MRGAITKGDNEDQLCGKEACSVPKGLETAGRLRQRGMGLTEGS